MKNARPLFFLLLVFVLSAATPSAAGLIDADDVNFQYSGRINFSNVKELVIYWPGTSIRTVFEGASLSIILNDQKGQSFYNVVVDDDFDHPYVLACKSGKREYDIPVQLTADTHSLHIFRRNDAATGPTRFLGVKIDDGKSLLPPSAKPQRRIEFYGDSITAGAANEAPDDGSEFVISEYNNYLSYAAITARNLDAEYSCIAKGGIGILISWFPLVMPDYYYRLNPGDPGSHWDFTKYSPDVVVVNLFQNDNTLIDRLDPVPDAAAIVAAYVDFVGKIRAEYADAFIVCSLGTMDAVKEGSPWPGYIEAAVAQMKSAGDKNLATYFFHAKDWWAHPRLRHHQEMADGLTNFIGVRMGWNTFVDKKNSALLPNDFDLKQNYPNPFNPATVIEFTTNQTGMADVVVYDTRGRLIVYQQMSITAGGLYKTTLDLSHAPSGIYMYGVRLPDNSTRFRKMTLLK